MFKLSTASLNVLTSATLSALACFAAASPCSAQSTDVRVNIPFAFQADQQHFKPGVYTIQIHHAFHSMQITGNSQTGQMMYVPDVTVEPAKLGKVVFHRYGSEYFLREIWVGDSTSHVHTLPSKAEKQLQLAANTASPHANNGEELALTQMPH